MIMNSWVKNTVPIAVQCNLPYRTPQIKETSEQKLWSTAIYFYLSKGKTSVLQVKTNQSVLYGEVPL